MFFHLGNVIVWLAIDIMWNCWKC